MRTVTHCYVGVWLPLTTHLQCLFGYGIARVRSYFEGQFYSHYSLTSGFYAGGHSAAAIWVAFQNKFLLTFADKWALLRPYWTIVVVTGRTLAAGVTGIQSISWVAIGIHIVPGVNVSRLHNLLGFMLGYIPF